MLSQTGLTDKVLKTLKMGDDNTCIKTVALTLLCADKKGASFKE